jgi:hypothetical protein
MKAVLGIPRTAFLFSQSQAGFYLVEREPMMRMSTSLFALCCQSRARCHECCGPLRQFSLTAGGRTAARTAKSVLHFNVKESVATSTHAGTPWLRYIRQHAEDRVQFWLFDGWACRPIALRYGWVCEPLG